MAERGAAVLGENAESERGVVRSAPPSSSALCTASKAKPSAGDLFQRHGVYVLGLLRKLGLGSSDVEDVLQDVFLTVHRSLDRYEERDREKAWITSIAVRAASRHRQRATRSVSGEIDEALLTSNDTPERAFVADEERAELERALDALDPAHKTVFVLFEIEELAMEHVAEIVGCPLATAYSRLRAARKHVLAVARRLDAQRRRIP